MMVECWGCKKTYTWTEDSMLVSHTTGAMLPELHLCPDCYEVVKETLSGFPFMGNDEWARERRVIEELKRMDYDIETEGNKIVITKKIEDGKES